MRINTITATTTATPAPTPTIKKKQLWFMNTCKFYINDFHLFFPRKAAKALQITKILAVRGFDDDGSGFIKCAS